MGRIVTKAETPRLVFIADIFRATHKRQTPWHTPDTWAAFAEALYHLCRIPANLGTGLEVSFQKLPRYAEETAFCYAAHFGPDQAVSPELWPGLYWRMPDHRVVRRLRALFSGAVVAGFDLSPFTRRALSMAGVPWLNADIYPVRYFEELLFAWSTNMPEAGDYLHEKRFPRQACAIKAAQHQARYTPNSYARMHWLPENSLLILPQSWQDPPPFAHDGKILAFADYEEPLLQLRQNYEHVFFYTPSSAHGSEYPLAAADARFLKTALQACFLSEMRQYPFSSSYMLFAHPSMAAVAGLNSKSLWEAEFFDKTAVRLAPPSASYADLRADGAPEDLPRAYPMDRFCFTPTFWNRLLRNFSRLEAAAGEECPLPHTRLIFRGGGSDFDDAASFSHCSQLGGLHKEVGKLWKDSRVHQHAHAITRVCAADDFPFEPEISGASPARHTAGTEHPPRYAAFSVGSPEFSVPATVALASLRRHSQGCVCDAYYFTDASSLRNAHKDILESHNIRVIHTDAYKKFSTQYMHGKAFSYVQFFAPEFLYGKGYTYSLCVHADTLCVRNFYPFSIFSDVHYIAASYANVLSNSISIEDTKLLCALAKDNRELLCKAIVNPGVLFFNNENMHSYELFKKAESAFTATGSENLLLNEESLLAALRMMDDRLISPVSGIYNYIEPLCFFEETPCILHYQGVQKPWDNRQALRTPDNNILLPGIWHIWDDAARNILGHDVYAAFIHKTL